MFIELKLQRPQSRDYIFQSTSRVLLYRDTVDRVLFYIKMTVMLSYYPHKGLKLVCQAMVEIFANFVAQVLNNKPENPFQTMTSPKIANVIPLDMTLPESS